MSRSKHLEKYILVDKKPVVVDDLVEWGTWFESANRHVAETIVKAKFWNVRVSTIFLGLDHNYFDHGEPVLFETMVFGGDLNEAQERYCTWEEAEAGHHTMVDRVRATDKWYYKIARPIMWAFWYDMKEYRFERNAIRLSTNEKRA